MHQRHSKKALIHCDAAPRRDAVWMQAEEFKSIRVFTTSRANLEANARSRVLSSPKVHRRRKPDRTGPYRLTHRVTHHPGYTSHISHVHSLPVRSHRLSRYGAPRRAESERYKRAEWIAATQGAAVGCGGWTDKAELERRVVTLKTRCWYTRPLPRCAQPAALDKHPVIPASPSRRNEPSSLLLSSLLLRFNLYRTQAHMHFLVLAYAIHYTFKDISYYTFCITLCYIHV